MTTLLIGSDGAAAERFAASLTRGHRDDGDTPDGPVDAVEVVTMPTVSLDDAGAGDGTDWAWADPLEAWRAEASGADAVDRVVVALWPEDAPTPRDLDDLSLADWVRREEVPHALWFAALGVAAARCADGGAVVAVVERPAPLDCAGWTAETGVADAVEGLVRSLARSEGSRGVRVAAVTTPARLTPPPVVDPPPALGSFPGCLSNEVAGAVRLLLSPDAVGLTGVVLDADCGRSSR